MGKKQTRMYSLRISESTIYPSNSTLHKEEAYHAAFSYRFFPTQAKNPVSTPGKALRKACLVMIY